MNKCLKCNREFRSKASKTNHEKWCDGYGSKIEKKKRRFICPKCGLEIKSSHKIHVETCDGFGPRRRSKKEKPGKNWSKGKKYEELYGKEKSDFIKKSLSKSCTGSSGVGATPEIENRRREKLRISILERYKNGWDPKCGRAPKINYQSPIAGEVKLDGSWELNVAQYLDENNIKWERNNRRFEYINLKNKKSTYKPDFYIYDWETYLEVKGYETKLDKCKWGQFPENLLIWRKEDLKRKNII